MPMTYLKSSTTRWLRNASGVHWYKVLRSQGKHDTVFPYLRKRAKNNTFTVLTSETNGKGVKHWFTYDIIYSQALTLKLIVLLKLKNGYVYE